MIRYFVLILALQCVNASDDLERKGTFKINDIIKIAYILIIGNETFDSFNSYKINFNVLI